MAEMTDRHPQERQSRLRLLPLALVALAAGAGALLLRDQLSFEALAANREALLAVRDANYALTAAAFVAAYAAIVAFSLPGATVATLTGGFLFATFPGVVFNVAGATIGATLIFLAARWGLGERLAARMDASEGTVKRIKEGIDSNQWEMLFLIRLVPAVPFFVANLVPSFVGVPLHRFIVTTNAARRLQPLPGGAPEPERADVRVLNRLLGDAVHQGAALFVDPLPGVEIEALADARCVLCLDQITDPHNVGAILRSAAAFRADAVVVTRRHSPSETGILGKSASGALDLVDVAVVTNLARAVETLKGYSFRTAALDSAAGTALVDLDPAPRWAFVLGAEGKGVRFGVAAACDVRTAIEVPGALASLNVSNAAAITLYEASRSLLYRRQTG